MTNYEFMKSFAIDKDKQKKEVVKINISNIEDKIKEPEGNNVVLDKIVEEKETKKKEIDKTKKVVKNKALEMYKKYNLIAWAIFGITVSVIIGFLVGYLWASNNFNEHLEVLLTEAMEEKEGLIDEYSTIVTRSGRVDGMNRRLIDHIQEKESKMIDKDSYIIQLEQQVEIMNNEIDQLRNAHQLIKEYEYILMHGNRRTDITFSQLQHGIDVMESQGLNPHLMFGLYKLESSGVERATNSRSTARGYGQFLESTGRWVYENHQFLGNGEGTYNHNKAFCGYTNMEMTASYLSWLMRRANGDVRQALINYNGGELGNRYYTIIDNHLRSGPGITLSQIQREYQNNM